MRVIHREDLAWAAGLFEGEGCVHRSSRRPIAGLALTLAMSDEDVVRRFHSVVGCGGVYSYKGQHRKKMMWKWTVQGHEIVQALLAMFWFWLGERRRGRWIELLQQYRSEFAVLELQREKQHRQTHAWRMFGKRLRDLTPSEMSAYQAANQRRYKARKAG